jgi:AraC-like DNA-binding protein
MEGRATASDRATASSSQAFGVSVRVAEERELDVRGIGLPRAEIQVVVRFGRSTPGGLDIHVLGARRRVHRKLLRGGWGALTVRLALGTSEAVLGAPASALVGRIVPLEELWGTESTRRLLDRLAAAGAPLMAARLLESVVVARLRSSEAPRPQARLALAGASQMKNADVNAVVRRLGVSERHFRRVFRETIGVSPKSFARLARFHRALGAARQSRRAGWAGIAIDAGYYDQSHLIAEFRAIAGATPQAFLGELQAESLVLG